MAKPLDDDTSAGKVTQGGREHGRGRTIWWIAAFITAILLAGVAWMTSHPPVQKLAPAEQGTTPVGGTL